MFGLCDAYPWSFYYSLFFDMDTVIAATPDVKEAGGISKFVSSHGWKRSVSPCLYYFLPTRFRIMIIIDQQC